ncbi:MAG TPA: TonB-dependent receptor [Longimicrobium sp.]|jgi:iron complex outermembrane receptor protein
MSGARAARLRRAFPRALALLALAAPAAARAAPACPAGAGEASPPAQRWPAPLDRTLSFHARDVSLRDALDRLAAAARLRISYSADLLPLERRVCVSHGAVAVGDALAELLRGTPVEPVVAGADHVVLAPRRAREEGAAPAELSRTVALERIVVTGSASGGPQRGLPVALDVIGGAQLGRAGTEPLTRLLSASLPGPWAWEQSPASLVARYGGIRGASSFGVSHPKVFIDGIEVANPLLVTQVAPEAVERIEVIRGPQGAALYGTDAISGVINIVTRHEGTDTGAPRLGLRTGLGMARSDFAPGGALAQEHALTLRAGDEVRSAGLSLGLGGVGEFVPGGSSRYLVASGGARLVGARTIVTGIARFYAARAGVAASPVLDGVLPDTAPARPGPAAPDGQRVRQYTLGATAKYTPDERWTHSLVVGVDGDRLSGLLDERTPVPTAAEAALRAAAGGADRGTLRMSSVARLGTVGRADLALTLVAEHSVLREEAGGGGRPGEPRQALVSWTHSTGVVAQGNAALGERLYLTAGLRVERNEGLAGGRYAALPVLGGAWVADLGALATLKVRAAYGRGIRPVRSPPRDSAWPGFRAQARGAGLEPEEQSGVEGGFDLAFGRALSLQVTRYHQVASGLIQRVALPVDTAWGTGPQTPYAPQNVGEISNRGWEAQGSAELGRLSLAGALSLVDSRVRRLAPGYTGDLRPGDRMLEVPARTLSVTAAWTAPRWSGSLTAYRASDWIGYDRLALARDFVAGQWRGHHLEGAALRDYWLRYGGVTRLGATAAVDVRGPFVLVLTGDNLLDRQRGEPDNLTVVPGRTLTLGLRAEF